ncbi:hypothetical protein IMZ48_32715, partial [Candidatus Bathyarchaeota archaeon]|nr:hypothetical protein [Candidatus Bathyarchaeota archaeon]
MHLSQYFKSHMPSSTDTPRIGLISTAKSHAVTHYKAKRISGVDKVEDLLYPNASGFRYFDFEKTCFPGALSPTEGIQQLTRAMTYRLPSKSTAVQKFIHRQPNVGHGLPPNAVLADQSMCPGHQSLTEYKALCTIPLGLHIQWQNILLQVASSSVDFKKVETSMAVLQCMYQAGARANTTWYRAGHHVPARMVEFGEKMLASLHDATARIEDNWSCIDELGCYIAIARRIMSLGGSDVLKRDVLAFLSRTRVIGLSWVKALKERVDSATDGEKGLFRSRVARAALVCSDTFNFQDTLSTDEDILGLAIAAPADATDFIECCITVQECYSPTADSLEPILYWRWQQLCVRAYPILRDAIVKASSNALDIAVQRSWAAFNPTGAGWSSPTHLDQKSWLVAQSASLGGGKSLDVHYCLVTGELRVNGLPLSRLPKKYEDHPMYATLFGSAVVEVMPGDVPGMVFSAKKRHAGHEVHFGLSVDGKDLLVRVVKDGRTWELVDPKVLLGFPQRFVSSYVHWYELSSKTVEFRARETPWKSLAGNWRLGVGKDGMWRLAKGEDNILVAPKLLDKKSHTAGIMKDIFSPLVKELNMELVYRPSLSQLEIDLPALKLAFYLAEGSSTIQSRQFRGMSIDSDQDIGTLFGLDNKLVLKGGSDDTHRKVILIEGPLTFGRTHSHRRVSGVLEKSVACHVYDVDTRLGRLIDNGSLESKVRVCYLHALTSFCLPDPLTKRTGTEQALDILSSAAVKSLTALGEQSISLLKRIAGLAPGRTYYPDHLKVMQSVTWAPHLGFIAQHSGLYRAVASLFESAAGRAFLYRDQDIEVLKLEKTSLELMTREEIRSATFRVSQYGAEAHTTSQDREYSSRDTRQDSEKARDAFYLADYIVNQRKELPCAMPANTENRFWRYLFEASGKQVLGSQSRLLDHGEEMPMYDGRWLLDTHQEILAKNLILYHDALSGRTQAIVKFDVAIWLSTLAFAKKADMTFIQLIASMVNERSMDLVLPPEAKGFYAGRGYTFHKEPILSDIMSKPAYRQFHACPEYQASKGKGYEEEERSRTRYTDNRTKALAAFVDCVEDQWPCSQPRLADHERMKEWGAYVESKKAIRIVYE